MTIISYVKNNLPYLSAVINISKQEKTEVYLCPSYIDDFGVLQDCKCGGLCNAKK